MADETKELWTKVEQYFGDLLAPSDEGLDAALNANLHSGLPAIDVPRLLGKFLALMFLPLGTFDMVPVSGNGCQADFIILVALPTERCGY